MPKEQALLNLFLDEKAKGRMVLTDAVCSGIRDTTSRLKKVLHRIDHGVDVLLTNP